MLLVGVQLFRRDEAELSVFTLIGQTVFEVKADGLGELLIDISGQPMAVRAGDMIGFHIVDEPVIPYDEDQSRMTTLYRLSLDDVEVHGHSVSMDTSLELARTYSLLANIIADCESFTLPLT